MRILPIPIPIPIIASDTIRENASYQLQIFMVAKDGGINQNNPNTKRIWQYMRRSRQSGFIFTQWLMVQIWLFGSKVRLAGL